MKVTHEDWRLLTAVGLIPAIVFAGSSYFFLVESPAYLATKGERGKAQEVLSILARQNGGLGNFGALKQTSASAAISPSWHKQIEALFGSRMVYTTLTVIYAVFVLNLIFYGTLYAVPQVADSIDMGTSPAISLLLGALWEFPGLLAGALFGTWFRRLPVILTCYVGMAFFLLSFAFGVSMRHLWYSQYVLHSALVGIKTFSNIAFVVVYQYSAEIYPAFARTTGNAVCVSCGRLGAILAPMVFEGLLAHYGRFSAFFLLLALLAAMNFVLVLFLPFETAGANLDDELEPVCPKIQGSKNPLTAMALKLGP
jgi:putative MFS transporter